MNFAPAYFHIIVSGLLLGTFITACDKSPPPFECQDKIGCVRIAPGEPLKIGVLQALSGKVKPLGRDQVRGILLAIEKHGAKFLNHPITLQTEDTGCTAEGGANAALKIIADPQTVAILGTTCSAAAATAAHVMSNAGLAMISGNNSAPYLTAIAGQKAPEWHPGYFRTAFNEESSGKAAASYAFHKLGVRRAATINDGDIYTEGLTGGFQRVFEQLGGDIPKWSPSVHNLEEIRTASLRARDVIRQLLSFSRKTELQKRPVSIISMIKESLTLMRASIPANITIEQDISEDSGAIVADPTQIHQVIINLCTNAAHAMEGDGGILHISAARIQINGSNIDLYPDVEPGPYLQLVVKDTGSGMPPDIKQRIFDPYFTTREVGKGSGMGLAVVHGIVQNHGGAITIDSEPGQGSTFTILIPAAEPDCPVEAPAPNPVITGGSERILLVDDETALLEITRSFLERHGYDVKATTDPAEALELFVANPDDFDLVITDMAMPNITGVELSKKIILIQPEMPVILCSGYSDAINAQQAIEMGIRSYVEKPVKLSVLEERIRQVLDDAYENSNT